VLVKRFLPVLFVVNTIRLVGRLLDWEGKLEQRKSALIWERGIGSDSEMKGNGNGISK
jgi:hypothetical protein